MVTVIVTTRTDAFSRGLDYLYGLRSLAPVADLIGIIDDREGRAAVCTWIGTHIDSINAQLGVYVQACDACFLPWERPSLQVFATPLASAFQVDGVCNLQTQPITLLIDVGRLIPADWGRLVVHEYAHAHAHAPGHHVAFGRSLTHLCLGLGLPLPPPSADAATLRTHPAYRCTPNPLAFWRGAVADWQTQVMVLGELPPPAP
ncbi:hypothetical protein OOK60_01925 [Trichothermofontia sichuanensis B231]|uniref:hypothetical protein n=1 Tax=Trichothermofontia sichuanensis TaxID=3045816 RepID=UPI00224729E5|nr:hypothetical protein [Trichothermofontia sichuanensis]UZQ54868.1 hypothetical protein OOK60_01925 [Trichothermofontia sichuanensis B231]